MTFFTRLFFVAVFLFVFAPAFGAKELEDRDWIEVSSPHFTVRSTLSKRKTIEMVRQAEFVRAAIFDLAASPPTESTIPTYIYAVSARDFDNIVGDNDYNGLFVAGLRQNWILIKGSSRIDESAVIKHEFVHDLIRADSGFDYPTWFSEGIAEYFETSEVTAKSFAVGLPSEYHADHLLRRAWVDTDIFLDSSRFRELSDQDFRTFYSQSWALVHYLRHSSQQTVPMDEGFRAYAAERQSGSSEWDSFAVAFEIDPADLRTILQDYLRNDCCTYYRMPIEGLLPEFEPQVREMPRAKVTLGLAGLAHRLDNVELTRRWLDIALQDDATRPRALTASARLLIQDGEFEEVDKRIAEALALAPDDPHVQVDISSIKYSQAKSTADNDTRLRLLNEAETRVVKAWRLDPDMPEVYVLAGYMAISLKQNYEKGVEFLETAAIMSPANMDIRLSLASAYQKVGRYDEAVRLAKSVMYWTHADATVIEAAQAVIDAASTDRE